MLHILNMRRSNRAWPLDSMPVTTIIIPNRAFSIRLAEIVPSDSIRFQSSAVQKVLDEGGRSRLIDNISDHLKQCTDKEIVRRSVAVFANVDEDLARRIAAKVGVDVVRKVNLFIRI